MLFKTLLLVAAAVALVPVLAAGIGSQAAAPAGAATTKPATAPATAPGANRFEPNVVAYEATDKTTPPPRNAILLAGDSQFYRWKTVNEDLPGYTIINRGIDSLQTSDLLHYVDRLVIPYKARLILLHVGGNDVHTGKTAEQVLADTKTLIAKIRAAQPDVPIIYYSTTPGPARFDEADKRKATNKVLQDWVATQKNMTFINLWDPMLTADGKPREDIWVEDRIHPNHEGYLIRVKLTLPYLGKPDHPELATRPAIK